MKTVVQFTNKDVEAAVRFWLKEKHSYSDGMGYVGTAYAYHTQVSFSVVVDGETYDNVEMLATAVI